MHKKVFSFCQLFGDRVLLHFFLLFEILLILVKHLVPFFIQIVRLAIDDQINPIFELVGCTCADSWVEKTEFSYVEVWNFKFVPDRPFVILSAENDYGVKLGDKCHELPSNASVQKYGGDFGVKDE